MKPDSSELARSETTHRAEHPLKIFDHEADSHADDLGPNDFGPFACLFSDGRGYRQLSMFDPRRVQPTLDELNSLIEDSDTWAAYLKIMMECNNWRFHIVAAATILLLPDGYRYATALWSTFDTGTLVAPQIGCTLFLVDPDFILRAKHRVVNRGLAWMPNQELSQRRIAILLTILARIPEEADWVAREKRKLAVKLILAKVDESTETFTNNWLAKVRSSSSARDIELPSAPC